MLNVPASGSGLRASGFGPEAVACFAASARDHARAQDRMRDPRMRERISKLVFGSKAKYTPLQAADLAAHATVNTAPYFSRRDRFGDVHPEILSTIEALSRREDAVQFYDAEMLEAELRHLPITIRQGSTPSQRRVAARQAAGRAAQRQAHSQPKTKKRSE